MSANAVLKCSHSNESYWAVLSCGTVYYAVQGGSNFWVCEWNPKVWPLKWKLLNSAFTLWCLLLKLRNWSWTWATWVPTDLLPKTLTSLRVRRITIFTFIWPQSFMYWLYMDRQHTTVDINLVTYFTSCRNIGAAFMLWPWDFLVNALNMAGQVRFLSKLPWTLFTFKWSFASVTSEVALWKQ